MNRASSGRERYSNSRSLRRLQPRWIVAGALLSAAALVLDYPVFTSNRVTGGLIALLGLIPVVISLTVPAEAPRGRVLGSAAAIVVVLAAYSALLYNERFAQHDGYSVSVAPGASVSQVQSEIRAIAGVHQLAANTSFVNDRIKVTFPGGDASIIAVTIEELRKAPGIEAVDACSGTLC